VRAAGGILVRGTPPELLLVHRPRYGDWTFPKGKCGRSETDEACALREVQEETGYACTLGAELASTSYTDSRGRAKTVRYWAMVVAGGSFAPNDEVDELRWLPPDRAAALLTYDRDRDLLRRALPALLGAAS